MRTLMLATALFTTSLLIPTVAGAKYTIDLLVSTGGDQSFLDDQTGYYLYPYISVGEDGASTDAFVSFTSPNSWFKGYENHPSFTGAASNSPDATTEVIDEVNGTWRITVEDDGSVYEYDVDVTLTLPFEQLPYFTSATLVNGSPLGRFAWMLEGGSAEYPGPGSVLIAELKTRSFDLVDREELHLGATSWTPGGDLSVADEFIGRVQMLSQRDRDSIMLSAVRPVTMGAPSLSFEDVSIRYTAERSATLGPPTSVPEPSTTALAILTVGGVVQRRRRLGAGQCKRAAPRRTHGSRFAR